MPFSDDEGETRIVHFDKSIKLAWFEELLSHMPDVQCVVFHEYIHSGELLCKALKTAKKTHTWLYGDSDTNEKRQRIVSEFQNGNAQFLVANSRSGGTAIDLPMADYLIFFESPVSPRQREQAAARPMARDDRPLMLDDLVCAPVERKILGFIAEGRDLYQALVQGGRKMAQSLRA